MGLACQSPRWRSIRRGFGYHWPQGPTRMCLLPSMALATSQWSFRLGCMASGTGGMIGNPQPGLTSLSLERMAVTAGFILRALAGHQLAVAVDVVADGTIVEAGFFVVGVVVKEGHRPSQCTKGLSFKDSVLGPGRDSSKNGQRHDERCTEQERESTWGHAFRPPVFPCIHR